MSDKKIKPVVLALGYFDSVHKGHRQVIKNATDFAKNKGAKTVIYTFSGNFKASLGGDNVKFVYTDKERLATYKSLGCDVKFVVADKDFLAMDRRAFLDKLNSEFNVLAYSCGEDYRFGKDGKGDVEFLKSYANSKGQAVLVSKILSKGDKKISST